MKLYFSNFEITGDIKPDVGAAYDLGTATRPFRDLYLTPDSIKFIGAGNLGSVALPSPPLGKATMKST